MGASTESLLRALKENSARPFGDARSLPPAIYHDAGILDLEIEKIFRKEWICIGRDAELPNVGDYRCRNIIDAPVFVIRQRDGTIKAFANVCVHRSSRLLDGEGHTGRISCPYHSWTYEIDGRLIGAPHMNETPGFSVANHKLKELACESWLGFVYVCLDAPVGSQSMRLAGLEKLIANYRIADYVPVFSREETWRTNWKCLVENFMDAYHLHRVHRDSFGKYGSSEDVTSLFEGGDAYTYHYVQEADGPKSVHAHQDNTWLQGEDRNRTYLINIFPSHTIQLQPDMLWYLSILPQGNGEVGVRWAVSIPREILDSATDKQAYIDELMELLHQVNSEDQPVVENVFRTTKSPDAAQGPLSYLERNVWEFGRYLARVLPG